MARRALRVSLVAFLTLIAVLIGIGFYVLNVALSDHLTFQQSDVAYSIVVTSKTVREFPQFTAAGQTVDFTYSARDGTAPGQIIMIYSSSNSVEDLDRKHRVYCERQGYSIVPENEHLLSSRLGCDSSDYRIEVDFQQRNNAILVTVNFLEILER